MQDSSILNLYSSRICFKIIKSVCLLFLLCSAGISSKAQASSRILILKGTMKSSDIANLETAQCIAVNHCVDGIEKKDFDGGTPAQIKGRHVFNVSVGPEKGKVFGGNVSFNYSLTVGNGLIDYKFYDFQHEQKNSVFLSAGQLLNKWDDSVESFDQKQYGQMVRDIKLSVFSYLQKIHINCVKPYE